MASEQRQHYERTDRVTSLGLPRDNRNHKKKQQLIADALHVEDGAHLLEVGCGQGIHATEYEREYNYTGVDIAESLVAQTDARTHKTATVKRMDACELPMPDNYFAAVVGTAILHHIDEQREALREWCRVAREQVVLMEPNYLFPTAFASAHLLPEERHKTSMAPWRLRSVLNDAPGEWSVEPRLFTPPWPASVAPVFDAVDAFARRIAGIRWAGQMLLLRGRL